MKEIYFDVTILRLIGFSRVKTLIFILLLLISTHLIWSIFLTGSVSYFGYMNYNNANLSKGCLKDAYENANTATQIGLEKSRLRLLNSSLSLKRPVQSLRIRGLNGLNDSDSRRLTQECETKATLQAILCKKRDIRILEKKLSKMKYLVS